MNTTTKSVSVCPVAHLVRGGMTRDQVRARLDNRTWRRFGRAVVLHNGPPTRSEKHEIALVNAGPRSMLTAFTALEELGLTGWHRDPRHVLVPVGANVRTVRGLSVTVHRTTTWADTPLAPGRTSIHAAAPAAVRAATSVLRPRTAAALLAATVQQGLTDAAALLALVEGTSNLRHRPLLLGVLRDIGMGAQALSEIDFAVLCRRAGLAEPRRQVVRIEPDGRRRYLDVEWTRPDGTRVVVEVDGALHLAPAQWWDDQFRQNEVVLGDSLVLRFPSVAIREGDPRVVDQIRRSGVPVRHHRCDPGPPAPGSHR